MRGIAFRGSSNGKREHDSRSATPQAEFRRRSATAREAAPPVLRCAVMAAPSERSRAPGPSLRFLGGIAGALLLLVACGRSEVAPPPGAEATAAAVSPPSFVGSALCAGCHPAEAEGWRGSHHDLALQPATKATVLGRFDAAPLTHFGVTTTLSERDGRFFARTEGPDGALADFEVTQTFGVDPLQQYLVSLPGGRRQALPWAWDARPAADGGQRWFHLQATTTLARHPSAGPAAVFALAFWVSGPEIRASLWILTHPNQREYTI